ncbi:MAG: hypothetical protein J6T10_24535 [Methanobrevibacter sp.]|nr:hypothetical protein [Methanobrevibacter sp.]
MIDKINKTEISPYLVGTPTAVRKLANKINEIIDYLNEQERINSYRVNWAHQDSITTTKRTYMSTKTGAIIDD